MQSPSKISSAPASTTTAAPAECRLQWWADLPEDLLQSIVPLLGSILEFLAFAGTCRSWRSAFSSHPSKSTFCTLFPPLLVRPQVIVRHLPSRSDDGHELLTCQVLDLANLKRTLRCQILDDTFQKVCFAGSSYGQMIFCGSKNCLVVDVFTGARVLPPQLPLDDDTYLYSGMLTAPIASHHSHLLVCAASDRHSVQPSLLDWLAGSDSWSELRLKDSRIEQIVEFNGQFIAMDDSYRLYTLSLAPQLGLQEIATVWWNGMNECPYLSPWIVVCGDMLLMVDHHITRLFDGYRAPVKYKAYRLDMSTVPASWVEVKKLESYSLFIGKDMRIPAFSCISPGRWGGRSNSLYYGYYYQPWILHGLGDDADAVWRPDNDPDILGRRHWYSTLQPFWVYPSMLYAGQ